MQPHSRGVVPWPVWILSVCYMVRWRGNFVNNDPGCLDAPLPVGIILWTNHVKVAQWYSTQGAFQFEGKF